jgi:hypothetical protein
MVGSLSFGALKGRVSRVTTGRARSAVTSLAIMMGVALSAAGEVQAQTASSQQLGSVRNRIVQPEPDTFILTNVDVQRDDSAGPLSNEPVYRITATKEKVENYLVLRWEGTKPGSYTFSTFVRPSADHHVTIQLHDDQGSGAIAHYSFPSGEFTLTSKGPVKSVVPQAQKTPSGWLRISVSAELVGHAGTAIVQISQQDPPSKKPGQLFVQGMMVEPGSAPTPYCRPQACASQAGTP